MTKPYQNIMKIEHEMFAHHYILTGDKEAAYKKVYPQAGGEALKIAARRLINHPDVRQYISTRLEQEQTLAVQHYHAEEQRRIEEEQATLLLKRKVLCDMIRGVRKQQRHYKLKDHIETLEDELSPMAVIRAIELDTKLASEWYGVKQSPVDKQVEPIKKAPERLINTDTEEYHELFFGPDYMPGLRAKMVESNPRKAEEYKEQGLRVLDYVPTLEDFERMKREQQQKIQEWKELKKFAEEQLDELDDLITPAYDHLDTDDVQPPASAPGLFARNDRHTSAAQKQNKTIQNDTKCTQLIRGASDVRNKASPVPTGE